MAVRSRSRAQARDHAWRRDRADLLARMTHMQDVAARARVHTAQVTKATADGSAGYKQGCSDMIKAMAALRGGVVSQHDAEKAVGGARSLSLESSRVSATGSFGHRWS